MKRTRQFEFYAAKVLEERGYSDIDVTRGVADWGADLFCTKDGKRYVGQVKMYGGCRTKISRKDVMELYGVMKYFDCQGCFFVYNGQITGEAEIAAEKLGVGWIEADYMPMDQPLENSVMSDSPSFEDIWNQYVRPLQGKSFVNTQGFENKVVDVTDAYIVRETAKGNRSRVKKDWFKWIVDRIDHYGFAEAIDLKRNEFHCQASSFVTLVFAQIPLFKVTYNPRRIEYETINP